MSTRRFTAIVVFVVVLVAGVTFIWSAMAAAGGACEWKYVKTNLQGVPYIENGHQITRWMEDAGDVVPHEVHEGYQWMKQDESRGDCDTTPPTTVPETTTTVPEPTTTTTVVEEPEPVPPTVEYRMQCPDATNPRGVLEFTITNHDTVTRTFMVQDQMVEAVPGGIGRAVFGLPPEGHIFTVYVDDLVFTDVAPVCEGDVDHEVPVPVPVDENGEPIAPVAERATLPNTGVNSAWLAGIALVAVIGGGIAMRLTNRYYEGR